MNVLQSLVFDEACHRRILRKSDVRSIQALYADNETVCQTEIAALLTINQACFVQDPSWGDFLTEALTGFVIQEMEPAGSVTFENAEWLISAIAPTGQLSSHRLREVVVALMARVTPTPDKLRAFLLDCLRNDLDGRQGAMASVLVRNPGAVEHHIAETAAVILASMSAGGLQLTRTEVQHIRTIDRLRAVSGSGVWTRFVETLAAISLLEKSDYATPDAKELVQFTRGGGERPWQTVQLQKLDAEALGLRALERQRIGILVAQRPDVASITDLAVAWGGLDGYAAARRNLADAGYELPAATGSRAATAA